MLKGNCVGKRKVMSYLPPNGLSERTRKDKVPQGLELEGAMRTEHVARVDLLDAVPKGQRIKKELVVRLLVPGRTRPVMEALPNVRWRLAEFQYLARSPGNRAAFASLLVQETASY